MDATIALYILIGVCIVFLCLAGFGMTIAIISGKEAIKPLLDLVTSGDALRMFTILFIVSAATALAVMGKLEPASVATILSGIAGYVLGAGKSSKKSGRPQWWRKRVS